MAYGKLYQIIFKNRIQNDIYRTEIWQKDYAGDSTELTGADDNPFIASYQDAGILEPIKSVGFTISFFNNKTLGIDNFYSDDDEEFRVDHYFQSFEDGSGTEKLLFSSYLVQDGASEPITDRNHILTLKATDNLALLKNVKWNEINDVFFGTFPLSYYFRNCLKQTGLYSADTTIDQSLPLRLYGNLFENTTDDRADDDISDPYAETVVNSGIFQSSDNTWDDCYTVLTKILTDINACLCQADGCWNVIRTPEYRYFTDGAILGTEYIYNGSGTDITAITLTPLVNIDHTGGDCYPVEEDQTKAIQRPLKSVLDTFNYNQPGSYIKYNDLQLPAGATPFATNTVGDFRYDDYSLAIYFPEWISRDGDTSYLEIVTDITTDPEQEKERYIVVPSSNDTCKGIQFNPIYVSEGDVIQFSAQIRTLVTGGGSDLIFWVRMHMIADDGNFYTLSRTGNDTFPDVSFIEWDGPYAATLWDTVQFVTIVPVIQRYKPYTSLDEWLTIDLKENNENPNLWRAPVSGMMLVQMIGANYVDTDNVDMCFKSVSFTIDNFLNESTQIVGQTHFDLGTSTIKATEEDEVFIDDSPRKTIAGTLFTDALTNFGYTDTNTGENTDIGNIYFTQTKTWHRYPIVEKPRLGNIIAQERLLFKYTSRLIVEGTFRNLRYDTDKFISILSFFNIAFYTGSHFLPASMDINYMNGSFRSRLIEIYNDADIVAQTVFLAGTKVEELGISTGTIQFDTISYFGGAATYLTPSISNSRFTYNGFTTTLDLSVIFFVPISGTGTATFTILKNGGVIATHTVNATEHFKRIDFLIPGEAVVDTDYFEASVNTGGADVDIQSGSINITVNGVISLGDQYTFNFLYKTD